MDQSFDYIILGGGMSGLSLARELITSGLTTIKTLAIIESRTEYMQDKIWSFWNIDHTDYDNITLHRWEDFTLQNTTELVECHADTPYLSIDSGKFYNEIVGLVEREPNCQLFMGEEVDTIRKYGENQASEVEILLKSGKSLHSSQVFNSLPPPRIELGDTGLLQHFKGIHISCKDPVFNADEVILMDFRTNQEHGLNFIYVLPFSPTEAVVESTYFSPDVVTEQIYDDHIRTYLAQQKIVDYTILYEERGVIPMVMSLPQQRSWDSIVDIGTRGGLTRPSTGYTFLTTQWFVKKLVRELERPEHKQSIPLMRSRWMEFLDEILLRVLRNYPQYGPEIFVTLFRRHPNHRVIRFLSGTGTLGDELMIMLKIPHMRVFVKESLRSLFGRLKFW